MINKTTTIALQSGQYESCATSFAWYVSLRLLLVLGMLGVLGVSSACGGGAASVPVAASEISGNWQFAMSAPSDGSFAGVPSPVCQPSVAGGGVPICLGGFLQQDKGSVSGQTIYSVNLPSTNTVCNAGSATVSGTANGQGVTLTVVAGTQTFSLSGNVSADGSTMTGTYSSTAGAQGCGTVQTGLQWTARLVPPLTGTVQGAFHSTGPTGISSLVNQDFAVNGSLTQGPNVGASSATITGTLNFPGYPCLATASVNGQISGNVVILQLIAQNGLNVGRIGSPPNTSSGAGPVTFQSSSGGGFIVQGLNGYGVSTKGCAGTATSPGDEGNVCLSLGSSNACAQPLSFSPATLVYSGQPVGSAPTSQTLTLTNTGSAGTLDGLQLSLNQSVGDFDLVPNFSEQDNCSATPGAAFSLAAQQSCSITISFSPQQGCPWAPTSTAAAFFAPPSKCPPFISAQVNSPPALSTSLTVTCTGTNCPTSASPDSDSTFLVPISGVGTSVIQPSTPELDFGPEDASLNEVSPPQSVSFANQSNSPIQILSAGGATPCQSPLPPRTPGSVPGFQVAVGSSISVSPPSMTYLCDIDVVSGKPNFQIVPGMDACSGALLLPRQSCSVSVVYAPQPNESLGSLDYFLELNTLECTSTTTANCEIDSGRFPVELKSGPASTLRLSPGAGLDFGTWPTGQLSYPPLTLTLSNDNKVANPQAINFVQKTLRGDYVETDDCGISLAPGSSCTMTITFTPSTVGFDPGSITLNYDNGLVQVINLRGFGQ